MPRKTDKTTSINVLQETSSQRILLEEFRLLHNDYLSLRNEGVNRVNFFITAMSVAFGGVLVLASQNSNLPIVYFKIILLVVSAILATIGLEIYGFLVLRDIASDKALRGLGRIRRYFIQLDPEIREYFVNRLHDTPTGYLVLKRSRMRRSLQIIEGFLIGLFFINLSTFGTFAVPVNVGISVGLAVLTALLLEINARQQLNKEIKRVEKDIRFDNL